MVEIFGIFSILWDDKLLYC